MPSLWHKYPLPTFLVTLFITVSLAMAISARREPTPQLPAQAKRTPGTQSSQPPVRDAFDPKASRPSSVLQRALQAAIAQDPTVLESLFADRNVATQFLRSVAGRIPAGNIRIEQPDEVDAGAENGHEVPVRVWVEGNGDVAGLQGAVRFVTDHGALRIRSAQLTTLPLTVKSWQEAAHILATKVAGAQNPKPAAEGFYGHFIFTDGAKRFRINAVSAAVDSE